MRCFKALAASATFGLLFSCSGGTTAGAGSGSGGADPQAGAGGLSDPTGGTGAATGGSATGGTTTTGGSAAGGTTTTGGSATGGTGAGGNPSGAATSGGNGIGGQSACGTADLSCPSNQLCVESVFYPNNIDPNNIQPPSRFWACKENPCGTAPLSCDCARSACGGTIDCSVSSKNLVCSYYAVCASPETRIATPDGERPIAELAPGDLVYSVDGRSLRPVPILRIANTAVHDHRVVELRLADGAVMQISPGHPTADGRFFGQLRAGDELDGVLIVSSHLVEYRFSHTYDILPASDTGTYVAFGKLIGSTLK